MPRVTVFDSTPSAEPTAITSSPTRAPDDRSEREHRLAGVGVVDLQHGEVAAARDVDDARRVVGVAELQADAALAADDVRVGQHLVARDEEAGAAVLPGLDEGHRRHDAADQLFERRLLGRRRSVGSGSASRLGIRRLVVAVSTGADSATVGHVHGRGRGRPRGRGRRSAPPRAAASTDRAPARRRARGRRRAAASPRPTGARPARRRAASADGCTRLLESAPAGTDASRHAASAGRAVPAADLRSGRCPCVETGTVSSRKAGPGSTVLFRIIGKSAANLEVRREERAPSAGGACGRRRAGCAGRPARRRSGAVAREAPRACTTSRLGREADQPAPRAHRGAQVHVLGVEEVALVEQPGALEVGAADQQAGAADPVGKRRARRLARSTLRRRRPATRGRGRASAASAAAPRAARSSRRTRARRARRGPRCAGPATATPGIASSTATSAIDRRRRPATVSGLSSSTSSLAVARMPEVVGAREAEVAAGVDARAPAASAARTSAAVPSAEALSTTTISCAVVRRPRRAARRGRRRSRPPSCR